MEKHFWAIELVHTGKMQKFATVSSQICIIRYVQRTLLLITLVCFCSICGPCFVGNIQKESWSVSLLQHCFIISRKVYKTTEKSPKYKFKVTWTKQATCIPWLPSRKIYFQLALIGITRLLRFRHLLIIETYQGLSFTFIYTRLVCKYSKGDWVFYNKF